MRIIFNAFILIMVFSSSSAFAGNYVSRQGDKEGFMVYCTVKQSQEFCQCAMDLSFDMFQESLLIHEKKKIQGRKTSFKKAEEYSLGLDSTVTVARLDALCDISDAFYEAKADYLLEAVGRKDPPRYDGKHNPPIYEIQKQHDAQANALHDKYGSNDTTRSHYTAFGGGYCTQRRGLVQAEKEYQEYLKKDQAGDVVVDYGNVMRPAIADPQSPCKDMFKR